MKPITLDELIIQLQELSAKGYGDCPVTANLEYFVSGVSVGGGTFTTFKTVDFDCYL